MKGFFALVDTSIQDAVHDLRNFSYGVLQPPFDTKLLEDLKVLLIVSVNAFLTVSDHLLDWDGVVILFDAPVKCEAFVGITLLDVEKRDNSFRYRFKRLNKNDISDAVKGALQSDDDIVFHKRKSNLLPYLLGQTSNSQMDRLQTWKYRVPPDLRDAAFDTLVRWFFASKPTVKDLQNRLLVMLGDNRRKSIDTLFEGNKFEPLKEAVLHIKSLKVASKSYSIDKVATKYAVSAFDIRYLMAVNEKRKKSQEFDPPFEVAKVQRAYRLDKPCPLTEISDDTSSSDTAVQAS